MLTGGVRAWGGGGGGGAHSVHSRGHMGRMQGDRVCDPRIREACSLAVCTTAATTLGSWEGRQGCLPGPALLLRNYGLGTVLLICIRRQAYYPLLDHGNTFLLMSR